MKDQFIPYNQAIALKELGFDEKCFAYYSVYGKFSGDVSNGRKHNSEFEFSEAYIPVPLWQQSFEWCLHKLNNTKPAVSITLFSDGSGYLTDYFDNEVRFVSK